LNKGGRSRRQRILKNINMLMTPVTNIRLKNALVQALHYSHLPRVWANSLAGTGAILALHRVRPRKAEAFEPNLSLEVTPEFLDQTIGQLRDLGFDIVSLDEVHERLKARRPTTRFVCFTLDDGYADNYHHAAPVFEANQAPFAIYATTGFLDGTALLWWLLLEEVIRRETSVALEIEGVIHRRKTATARAKSVAFADFHGLFRGLSAKACIATAKKFAARYRIEPRDLSARHGMTWDMARAITGGGLGTIEAHTVRHLALSRQEPEDIYADLAACRSRIEEETGRAPRHFAYPFGDADAAGPREFEMLRALPILTATTTKAGMLRPEEATMRTALPRLMLNGHYQSRAYVEVLLSGLHSLLSMPSQERRGPGIEKLSEA
jgi:peptidoglycan/xylan/chitin deacetylase (PgdA/CDA1 family)